MTLTDFITTVDTLAGRVVCDPNTLADTCRAIKRRLDQVAEAAAEEKELAVTGDAPGESESFDDANLNNLFAPLVASDGNPLVTPAADDMADVPF